MYNKINKDENISSLQSNESYDCGTATFGIAKGNIQSVLTLVISDPEGEGDEIFSSLFIDFIIH
jgi:hypothetical protein